MPALQYGLARREAPETARYFPHSIVETTIGKTTLRLVTGDIADQDTDAVATAAHWRLNKGMGTDGTIDRIQRVIDTVTPHRKPDASSSPNPATKL